MEKIIKRWKRALFVRRFKKSMKAIKYPKHPSYLQFSQGQYVLLRITPFHMKKRERAKANLRAEIAMQRLNGGACVH